MVVEGDILSINDVKHCKLAFCPEGDSIRYTIHSPIFYKEKQPATDTFPNGILDSRLVNIIKSRVLDYLIDDNRDDMDNSALREDVAIGLSVHKICEEVCEQDWYYSNSQRKGKWFGYTVPPGYDINAGCIRLEKYSGDEPYYITFCRTPCIPIATGQNIDTGEYWVQLRFMNIYNRVHDEWVSQQDALSRRGIMKLADRGINLIEKDSSTMNAYLSTCLQVNGMDMPRRFVTEKNGWKCDNTIFAFGKRGFSNGEILNIVPLRKEAYNGLRVCGDINTWINAVRPIIHLPLVRLKMYAVFASPLLRLLNVQSFILDHNGESSIGKTFTNDLAMSMIGDADTLRFNGDTTKTAAEILAEMYTDLPLYLDETGTQQSDDVLKALIYMLANEQGRMRGHKDGGLRETGKWKTVALTTGEKPLTSHKSFSGQQVRVIEVRGGLSQGVIDDVKVAADVRKENYGHFAELYFAKLAEYAPRLRDMYDMTRSRYTTKDNVKTNRVASSFAAMMVAGMLLEDIFSDVGIDPAEPHTIVDRFFAKTIDNSVTENYSTRALQTLIDWVQTKNACFYDAGNPENQKGNEFYGWIENGYLDIIITEARKTLEKNGYDPTRSINDWKDDGITKTSKGRNDYLAKHNGKNHRVIRLLLEEVNNVLHR